MHYIGGIIIFLAFALCILGFLVLNKIITSEKHMYAILFGIFFGTAVVFIACTWVSCNPEAVSEWETSESVWVLQER